MTNRFIRDWDTLIAELNHFVMSRMDRGEQVEETPSPSLLERAIGLAETFRDLEAPPANQLSAVVPGMIHFEWFKAGSTVVIALAESGEAEVVSYSNQGGFASQTFSWEFCPKEI